jgi:hypothetical protein
MRLQSSLSLYQCTLLPICTVATVQLLYGIGVVTVTISVTLLPICTVPTAAKAMCQYCGTIASKVQYVLYQQQTLLLTAVNSLRLTGPPGLLWYALPNQPMKGSPPSELSA